MERCSDEVSGLKSLKRIDLLLFVRPREWNELQSRNISENAR